MDLASWAGKESSNKANNVESKLREVCARLGIEIRQAAPEMQQQNPVERMIGTLTRDMATVLVQRSGGGTRRGRGSWSPLSAVR